MLTVFLATLLTCSIASASQTAPPIANTVRVRDSVVGCYGGIRREYEWKPSEDAIVAPFGRMSTADLQAIRDVITKAPADREDLLARIGFTPTSLAANRQTILETAWPESLARPTPLELPAELAHMLDYDRIAPLVRSELLGQNWSSTIHHKLEIEIAGDPSIHLVSKGRVAYMLPWTVVVGDKRWQSNDVEISRAVLALLERDGPNRAHVDGAQFWKSEFWRAGTFWDRFLGNEIDACLSKAEYAALAGYREAVGRFRIEKVQTGSINSQPDSLFAQMSARIPSAIDGAWWWSPLVDGKPASTWTEFLRVYDAASSAVVSHPWLLQWKASAPDRTIDAHVVGGLGYSETNVDLFVLPPWKDAGLAGTPEFQILLRRKGEWCGTVWLSSLDPAALILSADPYGKAHWFDELDVGFHPMKPRYGLVDGAGNYTSRHIAK